MRDRPLDESVIREVRTYAEGIAEGLELVRSNSFQPLGDILLYRGRIIADFSVLPRETGRISVVSVVPYLPPFLQGGTAEELPSREGGRDHPTPNIDVPFAHILVGTGTGQRGILLTRNMFYSSDRYDSPVHPGTVDVLVVPQTIEDLIIHPEDPGAFSPRSTLIVGQSAPDQTRVRRVGYQRSETILTQPADEYSRPHRFDFRGEELGIVDPRRFSNEFIGLSNQLLEQGMSISRLGDASAATVRVYQVSDGRLTQFA